MWKKLNSAKNFSDLYQIIGEDSIQKIFYIEILLLVLLPLFVSVLQIFISVFINIGHKVSYTLPFVYIGILACAISIFYFAGNYRTLRKAAFSRPWITGLLLLLLWMGICTLVSDHPWDQFLGTLYRRDGYSSYIFYAAFVFGAYHIQKEENQKKLFYLFSYIGSFISLLLVFQVWEIPNKMIKIIFDVEQSVIFLNSNHLAYYLTLTILSTAGLYLFSNKKTNKILLLVLFTLQFYALLANDTFGCYLASVLGVFALSGIVCFYKNKFSYKIVILIFIIFILSFLSVFNYLPLGIDLESNSLSVNFSKLSRDITNIAQKDESMGSAGSGRLKIWITTIERIKERPLFGWGPEAFAFYPTSLCGVNDRPHNEFLQWALFGGIPACLLYLFSLISLCIPCFKNLRQLRKSSILAGGCIIAYLISSCFGNTMFYTVPYFWMMIGFLMSDPLLRPISK